MDIKEVACPFCSLNLDADNLISHLRKFHPSRHHDSGLKCPAGDLQCSELKFSSVSALVGHHYKAHHYSAPKAIALPSNLPLAVPQANVKENVSQELSSTLPPAPGVGYQDEDAVPQTSESVPPTLCDMDVMPLEATECQPVEPEGEKQDEDESSDVEFEDMKPSGEDVAKVLEYEDRRDVNSGVVVNSEAGELVLYLRRKHAVPQCVVQEVIKLTKKLVVQQVTVCCSQVNEALKGTKFTVDFKAIISNAACVFKGLETKKQQDATFEKKLKIVKPRRVFIGRTLRKKRIRSGKFKGRQTVAVENHLVVNSLKSFLD